MWAYTKVLYTIVCIMHVRGRACFAFCSDILYHCKQFHFRCSSSCTCTRRMARGWRRQRLWNSCASPLGTHRDLTTRKANSFSEEVLQTSNDTVTVAALNNFVEHTASCNELGTLSALTQNFSLAAKCVVNLLHKDRSIGNVHTELRCTATEQLPWSHSRVRQFRIHCTLLYWFWRCIVSAVYSTCQDC